MADLYLEIRFALRDRGVLLALVFAFLITAASVIAGTWEIYEQRAEIDALTEETAADQQHTLSLQADAGSAAYGVHHFTYQPPSPLAFAAQGTRGELPWQHRVRMLALEGQIYEADTGNPELSLLGRLDFAFVAAILLPLILILLLYDLDARERRDGRYELLRATSAGATNTLMVRAAARVLLLFAVVTLPFVAASLLNQATIAQSLATILVVALHLLFWVLVCRVVTTRCTESTTAATALLACWLLFAMVLPAIGRTVIEAQVPVPDGGEILLTQREKVNDAWDLPKEVTMDAFVASHPAWREHVGMDQPFEWKWYYAFHQVGDEFVKAQSDALQSGINRREELMGVVAAFSPPLATQRWLTHLAGTNRTRHQDYLSCVRDFHAQLREFHYPMLFGQQEYSLDAMSALPQYQPCSA